MKNKLGFLFVILILFFGVLLRLHNYTVYPQRGATSDEYTYSFLGISLIKEHKPVSWSFFPGYKNKTNLTIKGIYFPIVSPYFDHPPLYGLLVGGFSVLMKQDTFSKVDLGTIRLIPIFLSLISSFLIFLIGKKLYGYKTGVWALLIFSTATFFIMNTRVVVAENLLTVFFLLGVYLFSLFQNKITAKRAIILGILSGLSLWTKFLGIALFLSLAFLFIEEKINWKRIYIFLIVFLLFFIGFLAYGYYFGWDLFLKIQFEQSGRVIGPQTLWNIIVNPVIVNKIIFDGWFFFGLFAFFASFLDFKRNKFLIVLPAFYFFLLLTSLNKEGASGWYFIPFFPFISLSIANLLQKGIKNKDWIIFLFIIFIGFTQIQYIYEQMFGLLPSVYRLLIFIMLAPLLFLILLRKEKLFQIVSQFWFYIFILGNIFMTLNYVHPL